MMHTKIYENVDLTQLCMELDNCLFQSTECTCIIVCTL